MYFTLDTGRWAKLHKTQTGRCAEIRAVLICESKRDNNIFSVNASLIPIFQTIVSTIP